jgi:hypothetical protein
VTNSPLLRLVGRVALAAAYAMARSRIARVRLVRTLRPTQGWRRLEIGDLTALVPAGWGEVEDSGDGGFVVHNRPRSARVDGDAVWYASAVELRIRRGSHKKTVGGAAMTSTARTLNSADGPVDAVLAVANGASPRLQQEAQRVLASVAVRKLGRPAAWPAARSEPARPVPLAHERVAVLRAAAGSHINQRAIDMAQPHPDR